MAGDEAPGDLALLEAFVNTWNVEDEEEQLTSPEATGSWLRERGLLPAGQRLTAADHRAALAAREALRALLLSNNGGEPDPAAAAVLDEQAAKAPLIAHVRPDGGVHLGPHAEGWGAVLARLLSIMERAQAEGTWTRMKACAAHTCLWAFYDHSRNRSRTWCDMAVCGNRAKARTYRRRQV